MCDYSLCGLPTRLAIEGEELIVHKFRSGSMGLVSPADLWPAERPSENTSRRGLWAWIKSILVDSSSSQASTVVCVPPCAQLILKDVPDDLQRRWNIEAEEDVVFVQLNANVNSYRDALRFRNGREVLLQHLREGLRVHVLSLGNAEASWEMDDVAVPVRWS